jgi:L-rhamnose mutarotase
MERYAWKATLKKGKKDEYVKRHNEIWQEMKDMLKAAGVCNYSIWIMGDQVFGYYECAKGVDYALKTQAESPVTARWNEYMDQVMDMPIDPETGGQPHLEQVFYFDERE